MLVDTQTDAGGVGTPELTSPRLYGARRVLSAWGRQPFQSLAPAAAAISSRHYCFAGDSVVFPLAPRRVQAVVLRCRAGSAAPGSRPVAFGV